MKKKDKQKNSSCSAEADLDTVLQSTSNNMNEAMDSWQPSPSVEEYGTIKNIQQSIAGVTGLPNVGAMELVKLPCNKLAIAFNLQPEEVSTVLLDPVGEMQAGDQVQRTKKVLQVPVGEELLGRIIDSLGRPLDARKAVDSSQSRPIEKKAPPIMHRAPVDTPLQTGILVIDALIPIGRGQRELILGDRQTGKTAVAIDTIINQRDKDVICIYCAIGQEASATARVISDLKEHDVLDKCIVVVATGADSPGLNFVAPYAATAIGEFFMDQGKDVLVVYDDLTRHAWAYRELSLLLRRPPAREAYPGDIFYIHSRLLERATQMADEFNGGSLTALPIIETQAQNLSAYIPTNLISITDGQIYMSPNLFQEGVLPSVDVGKSVSRVGGKAQLPAYRAVAGDLKLAVSQFEELEAFARFGTKLDEETQKTLDRGRRVREIFKQHRYDTMPVEQQIAVLIAVNSGVFDDLPLARLAQAKAAVRENVVEKASESFEKVKSGEKMSNEQQQAVLDAAGQAVSQITDKG